MIDSLYMFLLSLYPWDYSACFCGEMLDTFQAASLQHRGRGQLFFAWMVVRELTGLAVGALKEWSAKLTTDEAVRGASMPDLRMMRPARVPRELWFGSIGAISRKG
jgi:hypothetical protein